MANGTKTITKKRQRLTYAPATGRQRLAAWEALAGIWKNKRVADPVKWQRKIRKEWERSNP